MSQILNGLLNSTFALLLEKEGNGDDQQLVKNLDKRIEKLRESRISNDLLTSLTNLKWAVTSLRSCCENQDETRESQAADHSNNESELSESEFNQGTELPDGRSRGIVRSDTDDVSTTAHSAREEMKQPNYQKEWKDAQLAKAVKKIEADDQFKKAMEYFHVSNKKSASVFENESETETKIIATKVRVISEILGSLENLKNLTATAEKCKDYVRELHQHVYPQKATVNAFMLFKKPLRYVRYLNGDVLWSSEYIPIMDATVHINVVVFQFMKEFTRKSVAILDWPMIDLLNQGQEAHYPVLGRQSSKTKELVPFMGIDQAEWTIDSSTSAVNCRGEIFTKGEKILEDTRVKGIIKITPTGHVRDEPYSVDDGPESEIISISIDCFECTTSTDQSDQPNASASDCSPSNAVCKGRMYILVRYKSKTRGTCMCSLYVIDMKGEKEAKDEIGVLERSANEKLDASITCIKDKKAIILDVTRRIMYICDNTDEEIKKFRTVQLKNADVSCDNVFILNNGNVICPGESKLTIYNTDEKRGTISKKGELTDIPHTVQAATYNHKSKELIILCYTKTWFWRQYHLITYTDYGGLKQDVSLNNGHDYNKASLISHHNGPLVLLDNSKVLHLKLC